MHNIYCVGIYSNEVKLDSTLRQNSLCKGDEGVSFTCIATGTDLTWLLSNRMMSYNTNARVGSIRSNIETGETAILMRVDPIEENDIDRRRTSVLTITAQPSAAAPLRVRCHNGSAQSASEITFWRREAGEYTPRVILFS